MMYRARVEAVSDLKVRAGGKWLTCIGNRVVRAGDMVWTDGRCVYGHDREAQTPLVIVNPAKEDLAIPIYGMGLTATYTKKGAVSHEKNQTSFPRIMINNYSDEVYFFSKNSYHDGERIVAANIDKSGNWFTLSEAISPERLLIRKNNDLTSTIDLSEITANAYSIAAGESVPLYPSDDRPYKISSEVSAGIYDITGVIENEHTWHAFIESRGWQRMTLVSGVGTPNEEGMDIGDITARLTYYVNPHEQRFLGSAEVKTKGDDADIFISSDSNIASVAGLNVPLPDGYSFVVNSLSVISNTPRRSNITILLPSEKPLISTDCDIFSWILCYRVTSKKYLISLSSTFPFGELFGVHVLRDGEISETISDNPIYNQRLRPMRKFKNWWERIQNVDEGGAENE